MNNKENVNDKLKKNFKRNFTLLLISRIVSVMGSSVLGFAVSLYILDSTDSAAIFSAVLIASLLPGALVNGLAGVWVDRNNKKKIMIYSEFITGFAILLFMLLFKLSIKSVILFVIYTGTVSALQGFFNIAFNALIPNIVNEENVAKSNSIFMALNSISNVAGPVVGALLYTTIGIAMVMLVDGITFLISGICILLLVFEFKTNKSDVKESYLDGMKEIYRYLKDNSIATFLLSFAILVNFIYTPLIMVGIPYVNYNILEVSGIQLSIIQGASAVGAILGALIISLSKSNKKYIKNFFPLLMGQAVIFMFWIFPSLSIFTGVNKWVIALVFAASLVLLGVLNTVEIVPIVAYFQVQIPEEIRGRMMGFLYTILIASAPLGIWVYGILLDIIDWSYIAVGSGIAVLLLCAIGWRNKIFRSFCNELEEDSDNKSELAGEGI